MLISRSGYNWNNVLSPNWWAYYARGVGGTPYNGVYKEVPPKRGTIFRLEAYERAGKTVI